MAQIRATAGEQDVLVGDGDEVFGTNTGGESYRVAADEGLVTFQGGFIEGGDTIYLEGPAESWTVRSGGGGSFIEFIRGDLTVRIPVPDEGSENTIVFVDDILRDEAADGDVRELYFDADANTVVLGDQQVGSAIEPVDAGPAADVPYTIQASAPTVTEGDAGSKALTYTITLDRPAEENITLNYVTLASGSASANDDYQPVSGTVTILAGTTTAFVSVPVLGDVVNESNETVNLQVSGPALAAPAVLTGTIIDDDGGAQALNVGSEVIQGTTEDDEFRASNNELGAGDEINDPSTTDEDTLRIFVDEENEGFDAIFDDGVAYYRAFETTNVENIYVTNDSDFEVNLDMSGATGVEEVGSVNSSNAVVFDQVTSLADVLVENLTIVDENEGTRQSDVRVYYRNNVTDGTGDDGQAVTVTIRNSDANEIELGTTGNDGETSNEGIETVNLVIDGDSYVETLNTDLTQLNISGEGDLEIEDNLNTTVEGIDASGLEGDLVIDFENTSNDVTVEGAQGDNNIDAGTGSDTITTFEGADNINGNDGADAITTNGGDDTVDGGNGDDFIDAGDGSDEVFGGFGDDTVLAGEGDNFVSTGSGSDDVTAGAGADTIDAGDGDNVVDAGDGDNIVTVQGGNDDVTTGSGDDSVRLGNDLAGANEDTVSTGAGNDTVDARGGMFDAGTDTVADPDNVLDSLDFGEGTDKLFVTGNDIASDAELENVESLEIIEITGEGTTVLGDNAEDAGLETVIAENAGIDVIDAAEFDTGLTVQLADGADTVTTGDGDDLFIVATDATFDAKELNAGLGNDTLSLDAASIVAAGAFSGFEQLTLGTSGDEFDPNDLHDHDYAIDLSAANAPDTDLATVTADETLTIDAATLESDEELVITRNGTYAYNVNVASGAGADTIETSNGDDHVIAGAGNDTVTTNQGDDTVSAGEGDDSVSLGAGDDLATGGAGDDTIGGGAGSDSIRGGEGDDEIRGGDGDDFLQGGLGADLINAGNTLGNDPTPTSSDVIYYVSATESSESNGVDTIINFSNAEDTIDVSEMLASLDYALATDAFDFSNTGAAATSQANGGDGEVEFVIIDDFSDINLDDNPFTNDDANSDTGDEGAGNGRFLIWLDTDDDGVIDDEDFLLVVETVDGTPPTIDQFITNSDDSSYNAFSSSFANVETFA